MKEMKNEIYSLVDEEFISKFQENHAAFMQSYYYDYYCVVCGDLKRKPLSKQEFFHNMRRRRIQLYQLCCPYCGTIEVLIRDKKHEGKGSYNYCVTCGRGSAFSNMMNQVYRFSRISNVNKIGLKALKEKYPEKEDWLIGYDCYQMELIELASIIEVIFRDYFEALVFIGNLSTRNEFLEKIIKKYTGNDFMNIEKANSNFKKAFGLDIKAKLEAEVWNELIDIVNLRNMMVHNNGSVDQRFKTTSTYGRLKNKTNGNLFKLTEEDIQRYLKSVVYATVDISNMFLEKYYSERNAVIANHYFNRGLLSHSRTAIEETEKNHD